MQVYTLLIPLLLLISPSPDGDNGITGKWKAINREGEKGIVKVYEAKNGKYYGVLVRANDPEYNQEIQEKEKPVYILIGMEYEGGEVWRGTINRPKHNNQKLRAKAKLINDDKLKVTGYKSIFSRSVYWERISD